MRFRIFSRSFLQLLKLYNSMNESTRQYLLKNENNRFFCDRGKQLIHDRDCKKLITLKEKQITVLSEMNPRYIKGKTLCSSCLRKMAVRNGLRGQDSRMGLCMSFFNNCCATDGDLVSLFLLNDGRLSVVSKNTIEIRLREDTWRIVRKSDAIELQHNNYTVLDDDTRRFTGGFHLQNDFDDPSFHNYARIICGYTFEKHKKAQEAYNERLQINRLETSLALLDNYIKLDYHSVREFRWPVLRLLFDYYRFVDIEHTVSDTVKVISTNEDVVICRVPRWKNGEFIETMKGLKATALQQKRFEYVTSCENAIPQIE